MLPAELAAAWLKLAEQQKRLGAAARAYTLRYCAEALECAQDEDHLGRLVTEGKIPNEGGLGRPGSRGATPGEAAVT